MGRASLGRGWGGRVRALLPPPPPGPSARMRGRSGGGGTHTDSIPPAGPLRPRRASLRAPPCRTGWGLGGELPKPRGDFGVLGGGDAQPRRARVLRVPGMPRGDARRRDSALSPAAPSPKPLLGGQWGASHAVLAAFPLQPLGSAPSGTKGKESRPCSSSSTRFPVPPVLPVPSGMGWEERALLSAFPPFQPLHPVQGEGCSMGPQE